MHTRVIGLTGGIGSGKSTVAAMLRALGGAVVDADVLARQVVEPGQPAHAEIVAEFGDGVLAADGTIDRKKLGEIVFHDAGKRRRLAAITHPRIAAAAQAEVARHAAAGAKVVFYEAALIVENGVHHALDGLIVVSVPEAVQLARVMARDGSDEAAARARIAAQLPLADKLAVATHVVDNGGDQAATKAQVERIYAALAQEAEPAPPPPPRAVEVADPTPPERILVTGFPSFTAIRFLKKILASDAEAQVFLLVREKFARSAEETLATLPEAQRRRVRIVQGDVCDMDLGLAGPEYRELADQVTTIHHLAGIYFHGVDRRVAERVNVEGTRGILELAGEARRLRRLCHWSTASVSGRRKGVVLEEELDEGQAFHNFYEQTKYEAETLVRAAARRLPVTVFRPGVIVGDSRTGEIDRFDGPYYLMVLIVQGPLDMHLPLPGRGAAPIHLVPIDFVVDAGYALSLDDRAAGMTFHLTDPTPFAAKQIYDLVAERAQKKRPRGFIPTGIARALMRTPGLERLARAPRSFLESFDHQVFYNCRQTLSLLQGTGIRCPPFDSYVDNVIRYVREVHAARRQKLEDEVFDPFI